MANQQQSKDKTAATGALLVARSAANSSSDREAEALALVNAQALARQAITDQGVLGVEALVRDFNDWWNTEAITALVGQITSVLQPRQRIIAGQTDAYLARMRTLLSGRLARPIGTIKVEDLRTGTTMPDVYGRLADNYRYRISQGATPEQAQQSVVTRSGVMAEMDQTLAMRDQAQAFYVHKVVTGYRRVIHPELPHKTGVCGLCIVASDRLYGPKEPMPLHERCMCTPIEVYNGIDLGSKGPNGSDLTDLYGDAGGNTRQALKRIKYSTHQNSERGPILAYRGEAWRTPGDVAADTAAA